MTDYIKILNNADASQITSFLKNDIGNGSMKDGLIKLISNSNMLDYMTKQNKNKNIVIGILGTITAGLVAYIGIDKIKKKKEVKLDDKKEIIEKIEKLSESEIENIVKEVIEDENDNNDN